MRFRRYLGSLVLLLCITLSMLVAAPAEAYQPVIFDGHVHSEYSREGNFTRDRTLEDIGADLHATFLGIPVVGCLTDHSDVVTKRLWGIYPLKWRYVLTPELWTARQDDIGRLSTQYTFLPGEEVTFGRTGDGLEEHGHLLVYGLNEMVSIPFEEPLDLEPDPNQPGAWLLPESVWEGNPPRKDVRSILNTLPYGATGYIAHPNGSGPSRQDQWTDYAWAASDRYIGGKNGLIKGMEILSAGGDHTVQYIGLQKSSAWSQWESKLASGRNMFVIGGSDSHGPAFYPQIGSSFTYLLLDDNEIHGTKTTSLIPYAAAMP